MDEPKIETDGRRVLVVTAYYKEERRLIERTIRSIAGQSARRSGMARIDHLLVADGFPQDWIDGEDVRHVRLDRSHADYGNTPRGVGSLLGIVEGYDAICYCDADNWYEPQHVEVCLKAADAVADVDYVIAHRIMRRPDETAIPVRDESHKSHVDTNCFFFLPGSYHLIHRFAAIPRQMSVVGDRLFYGGLQLAKLKAVKLEKPSVNYECLWESIYLAIGETPPAGAKPQADTGAMERWFAELGPREKVLVTRRTGLPLGGDATAPAKPTGAPRRFLAITPYHKEDRAMLERCIGSVRAQTVAVDHLLVADGFPQDWIDEAGLRHVRLDRAHGDHGNTPRGVGSIVAISEDYDGFFYLDADNWLEPNHVEACLAAADATATPCDWVLAQRFLRRPDGAAMPVGSDVGGVDADLFFFLRGAYHLVPYFAQQPREITIAGAAIFHDHVLKRSQLVAATVPTRTVDHLCMWSDTYLSLGETPPPGAEPSPDGVDIDGWLAALGPRRRKMVERLIGFDRG
ncbi:MAG: glycosyltransferase family 2 protein [Hyphomicrobiales bacterium]|nr:glycosyltransferase family 2 protein [Hyphomicrobiales bacterium]